MPYPQLQKQHSDLRTHLAILKRVCRIFVEFKSCLSKLIRSSRAANNFGLSFKMLLAAMENDGNIEILLIEHDGG